MNKSITRTTIGLIASASLASALLITSSPAFSQESGSMNKTSTSSVQETSTPGNSTMKAGDLRAELIKKGYTSGETKTINGERATTYSTHINDVNLEFLVPESDDIDVNVAFPEAGADESGTNTHKVNFGWDNGPRLYMTGTDFWSLGATGVKEVCGKLPAGSGPCSDLVDRVWKDILTGPGKPLRDGTCYDLSQTLNVGWEKVSASKCK